WVFTKKEQSPAIKRSEIQRFGARLRDRSTLANDRMIRLQCSCVRRQLAFQNLSPVELQRCFSGFPIGSPTSFSELRKLLSASSLQCSFSFWLGSSESMAGDATARSASSGVSRSSFVSNSLHTQRYQFIDLLINPGAFGFQSFESKF